MNKLQIATAKVLAATFPGVIYTPSQRENKTPYRDRKGQWFFWSYTQDKYVPSALKPKGKKKK